MNNIILTPVPVEDLLNQVRTIIKEEIQAEQQKAVGEKLLSPEEARKLFQPAISRVTLQKWTDDGHLKRYNISCRVYYRYSEIIEAVKHLKKYK